jgi:hypothetical protein
MVAMIATHHFRAVRCLAVLPLAPATRQFPEKDQFSFVYNSIWTCNRNFITGSFGVFGGILLAFPALNTPNPFYNHRQKILLFTQ